VASNGPIDPEVLVVREAAWRAYFGGDVKALGDMLPAEFIGIGMNDAPFMDRSGALDASGAFREGEVDSSASHSPRPRHSSLVTSWCSTDDSRR
jgi:hypothetical protein